MLILRKNFAEYGIKVEPLSESKTEYVTFDLHAGGEYIEAGYSTAIRPGRGFKLAPGRCVLLLTRERLDVPDGVFGVVYSRVSLAAQGLVVSNTKIDPRFVGNLDIAVFNAGRRSVDIKLDMALCAIAFYALEGETGSGVRTAPNRHAVAFASRFRELYEEYHNVFKYVGLTLFAAVVAAGFKFVFDWLAKG